MEQLGSHRLSLPLDFHEISYISIFRKSVKKTQVSLKSDKNKGHFTFRHMYIYDISMNPSSDENFSDRVVEEIKTDILRSVTFFEKIVQFMR